jgi:uncharacterized protein DUF5678
LSQLTVRERNRRIVRFDNDLDWLNTRAKIFRKKYGGKYVAIRRRKVLDADKNLKILLTRLRRKGFDMHSLLIKYVRPTEALYVI